MNLRHLRYFVAIVDHGSMVKASDSLFVAQSALSQHMRNLEAELGVQLLLRTGRGVVPTEAGQDFLGRARAILAQVEDAQRALREQSATPQGNVTLGAPPTVSAMLAVPLILQMQQELPKVALRVAEGMSGYVLDWLQAGQIDLGLVYGIQRAPGIVASELFTEELFLVGPADDGDLAPIPFAALEGYPLVLPGRQHGLRDMIDRLAREHRISLRVQVEIDALSQMKLLVRHGVGHTILPLPAVRDELARGELIARPIVEPRISRTIYVAKASDRPQTPAVLATVRILEECVRRQILTPSTTSAFPIPPS
jgi:LysR family nitrogen assimilation transcriptional regulator